MEYLNRGRRAYDNQYDDTLAEIARQQGLMMARQEVQCSRINEILNTVGELRDYQIRQIASLKLLKGIASACTAIGLMFAYYLATGNLPLKELLSLIV